MALSNALHANPALGDSIAQSARLVGPPLSQELSLLHKECRLGMPLDRALRQLGARVHSPIVSAALATLRVARGTALFNNRSSRGVISACQPGSTTVVVVCSTIIAGP